MSEKLPRCGDCPQNGHCAMQDDPVEMIVTCTSCNQKVNVKLPNEPPLVLMFLAFERDDYVCEKCDKKSKAN